MISLKEFWTKEVEELEVKISYQYVFELREKLEETLKLAPVSYRRLKIKESTIMIARREPGNFSQERKLYCQLITISC